MSSPLTRWFVLLTAVFTTAPIAAGELPTRGICAHRGASATYPENTIEAFREAARLGAHMIEFDLWLTKDGVPIVMHDSSVDRTTNGKGKIAELTCSQIKQLDAGIKKGAQFKGEKVPTFEEALDAMPQGVWLNIHMKQGAALGKVAAEVIKRKGGAGHVLLACTADAAKAARTVLPEVRICCMDRQYGNVDKYVETAIGAKADFIQLVGPIPPNFAKLVSALKAHQVKINYFGITTPEGLRKLIAAGVDFPLVDDVSAGLAIAAEFGIEPIRAGKQAAPAL